MAKRELWCERTQEAFDSVQNEVAIIDNALRTVGYKVKSGAMSGLTWRSPDFTLDVCPLNRMEDEDPSASQADSK
jgi:hypothetical protein